MVLACAFGQCPKRPAMTIFRAGFFQPSAIIAHEISEPTGVRVPSVLDESREACRECLGQLRFASARKRVREQQGASIIVDTIAMGSPWTAMGAGLHHARTV